MNAANVAQHRIVINRTNTWNCGQCHPVTPKKATKFGIRLVNGIYILVEFSLKVAKFEIIMTVKVLSTIITYYATTNVKE